MFAKTVAVERAWIFCVLCLAALAGCITSAGSSGGNADGTGSGDLLVLPGFEAGSSGSGQSVPSSGVVGARIRNVSGEGADVDIQFTLNGVTIHSTFIHVPARTSTTVVGPEDTDTLFISGQLVGGAALDSRLLRFGVDFDDGSIAEFVVGEESAIQNAVPVLGLVQPDADVRVVQGQQLEVVITDDDPDSSAQIDFYLDPDDVALNGNEISLAVDQPEDPDGAADSFLFLIDTSVPVGFYRLVAVIRDELSTDIVQSLGLVEVAAADLIGFELVGPAADISLTFDGSFTAAWTDDLLGANGQIDLFLDLDGAAFNGGELVIGSTYAEDPDGGGDQAVISVAGIAPGTYRLIGRLTGPDGSAEAVAPGLVTVLANEPPTLNILSPGTDTTLAVGSFLLISWEDSDDDSNASMTFYLDPNSSDLDGGEFALGTFDEDPDGDSNDRASLSLGVAPGVYWLFGVIQDESSSSSDRSAGLITVVEAPPPPPPDDFVDCQPNGVPDDQELADNDCNSNGIIDACESYCVDTGLTQYILHSNPEAIQAPPLYGLRLDDLFDLTEGKDVFTFDFDNELSSVMMEVTANSIHIYGQAYGGWDIGDGYGEFWSGMWEFEFLYDVGVQPVPGDDDIHVVAPNGSNSGQIRPLFGENQTWIPLEDYSGEHLETFRFGDWEGGYDGWAGLFGRGWLNHGGNSHIASSDWNFKATVAPEDCLQDCNTNSMPDDCDIENETSQDHNENNIPDECERLID